MSKELIERLRGFKDTPRTADNLCHEAADRIEELERANQHLIMALADAEALEIGTAERCDALQADNARLREALEYCVTQVGELATVPGIASALSSTPEQSLAEYRNNVIEECASVCDKRSMRKNDGNWTDFEWDSICRTNELAADEIRAMKE